ncbi:FAD:protein FMN transferase [Streptomyces yaanensis]|uniref:FAD:protein FMN transferase n=1 Tax=Streptomyces yaanensis TaxID=1142239 RepID=A0ABV7SHU4_9ACTN|nr:FAD:protein FMN transferase [Streptomyces sp. CGMCC 4.7035]WNB98114.1 FAD:protein FMN transferase [Streptomyces sp. CGMCC 4.7035]
MTTPTAPPATVGPDRRALGTSVRLVVTDPALLDSCNLFLARHLAEVDAACSRFRDDSELAALDRAEGRPTRVSPLLAEALAVALRAAKATDGAVDPTIGSAMNAIGYDRDFALVHEDDRPVRLTVRPVPGRRLVELDGTTVTVAPGRGLGAEPLGTGRVGAAGAKHLHTHDPAAPPPHYSQLANSSSSSASSGRPTRRARTPDSTARNSVQPRSRS